MEIRKNDYILLNNGELHYVDNIDDNKSKYKYQELLSNVGGEREYKGYCLEEILGASNNILDLLTPGDVINGKMLYSIDFPKNGHPIVSFMDGTSTPVSNIKTIVTKIFLTKNSFKLRGRRNG